MIERPDATGDDEQQHDGQEDLEEFKQEVKDDPSTASDDDDGVERLRGG